MVFTQPPCTGVPEIGGGAPAEPSTATVATSNTCIIDDPTFTDPFSRPRTTTRFPTAAARLTGSVGLPFRIAGFVGSSRSGVSTYTCPLSVLSLYGETPTSTGVPVRSTAPSNEEIGGTGVMLGLGLLSLTIFIQLISTRAPGYEENSGNSTVVRCTFTAVSVLGIWTLYV